MKVQVLVDEGRLSPDPVPDPYLNTVPAVPEIEISLCGLLKLHLKPGKAAAPDKLKPLLLKELREEITPIGPMLAFVFLLTRQGKP